jgi:hypothetical protein
MKDKAKGTQQSGSRPKAPFGSNRIEAIDDGGNFDRAASTLFQVPESAVDDAEAKRPKREHRESEGGS